MAVTSVDDARSSAERTARRAALRRVLEARSVAVVGASARPGSFGERMAVEVLRSGSGPRVHFVHPSYSEVVGRPCVPSLDHLPEPVDLAVLGVPDRALVEQVARARGRDDGGALIFGSAVGLGSSLREAAGAMPLVGAGCMGFVNVARGLRALGYVEREVLQPGPIALLTHSGSAFSALLRTHRRLEYSVAVSSGQELTTTTADYLDYALSLPETRVVGLFLETMRDVPRLREGLARAAEQDVPVVALAVGATAAGSSLVAAHSGAVAGADGAWEALFRAYGVHRVHDLDELVDTLELFSLLRKRRPRAGTGIATVHDSGGERVLTADLAEEIGVPFAPLADATLSGLTSLLADGLVPGNPLDVWGTGANTRDLFGSCLSRLAADPAVGVTALAVDFVEEYDGDIQYVEAVQDAAAEHPDAAFVVLTPMSAGVHQPYADRLRASGIPVLEGLPTGLRALRHLLTTPHPPNRDSRTAEPRLAYGRTATRVQASRDSGTPDVATTLELLAEAGLPVIASRRAASEDEALAAAAEVGYPVALKTTAADHKTEVGGVLLGLPDPAAVAAAYARLSALGDEVLVQAMAPSGVELNLGIIRDPHLGPLVVLGAGGVLVELVGERVVALPPFTEDAALAMLEELPKVGRLLDGYRGSAPVDRRALARAAALVSELAVAWDEPGSGPVYDALDVNPLLCTATGVLALDALLVTR